MHPTPYHDVTKLLDEFVAAHKQAMSDNLVGIYLTGSLTYGDFDPGSSDIDLLVVLGQTLTMEDKNEVRQIIEKLGGQFPQWKKRIEVSYVTQNMLLSDDPPRDARPYINAGKLWECTYGNEWILNLFVLYEHGVALYGPSAKHLFRKIDIDTVRAASTRDLLEEWSVKAQDPHQFESPDYDSSHLQVYAILTMCRILHRARHDEVISKKIASAWVKENYVQWRGLIEQAEKWRHGEVLMEQDKTKEFIRFVIKQISSDLD